MIDYLTDNLWLVWTLFCVLALILEVSSGTFYILCFAIGAAAAIVLSLFGIPFWLQVLLFAVVSVVSIYGVRPLMLRWLHPSKDSRVSNADALLGRTGVVIEPITADTPGYVKIDGDEWRAVTQQGISVPKGTTVKVVGRESIIVTVEPI
jgi:membrane protein implicated in regulation of membrane protease activity